MDSRFCLGNRRRWQLLTADPSTTRTSLRLFRSAEKHRLDPHYSTRKFRTLRSNAWDLMRFQLKSETLRRQLRERTRNMARTTEAKQNATDTLSVRQIEEALSAVRTEILRAKRERIAQQFLYAAVRYQLIDPAGLLFDDDEVYQQAIRRDRTPRADNTLKPASDLPRSGRSREHTRTSDAAHASQPDIMPDRVLETDLAAENSILKRFQLPPRHIPNTSSINAMQSLQRLGTTVRLPQTVHRTSSSISLHLPTSLKTAKTPRAWTTSALDDIEKQAEELGRHSSLRWPRPLSLNSKIPLANVDEARVRDPGSKCIRDKADRHIPPLSLPNQAPSIFRTPVSATSRQASVATAPRRLPTNLLLCVHRDRSE